MLMRWRHRYPNWFWWLFAAAVLLRAGAIVRLPDAQGDVNLFCLAAEHWAQDRALSLGIKNHFDPALTVFGLNEPQSQHLPLWPMLAGAMKVVFSSVDTYRIFQTLSLLAGCGLLLLVYETIRRLPPWAAFAGVALCACHPLLIEYSANGSFYILMACQWLGLMLLLPRLNRAQLRPWISIGVLLGLSLITHYPQSLLLPVFLLDCLVHRRRVSLSGLSTALLLAGLPLAAWSGRNTLLFGDPFYSSSILNFLSKWGLLTATLQEGRLVQISQPVFSPGMLSRYLAAFPLNAWQWTRMLVLSTLLWPLFAAVHAGWRGWKSSSVFPAGWAAWILALLYLGQISFWGFIRPRFLVPLLPLLLTGAAVGMAGLAGIERKRVRLAMALVAITLAGFIAMGFVQGKEPDMDFAASRQLALWLKDQPEGTVLGYSERLDGGIEGVRFHRQPYVDGRNFLFQPAATVELLRQYQPRYLWCDSRTRPFLEQLAPMRLMKREGHLCILEPGTGGD